eukprot:CAMPEP_0119153620 /NCGR_PEP_ID=MMETSP1310-20130426/49520_1 /TAXON_ID=464262 /ORGANISM="Genus nov. species nov., Strain RCC2339" /LENGTH=50 /DNA_ID=CAMNT_0007146087 /DNA_START=1 /DNA_END=150 /DNA_ORIENTATION=+
MFVLRHIMWHGAGGQTGLSSLLQGCGSLGEEQVRVLTTVVAEVDGTPRGE